MGLTNFPNGISSMGVPVVGPTTGTTFYVDSATGTDSNAGQNGKQSTKPFATLDYAIGQCTANKGDVIYLLPGHAESIISASLITVDIAGISIIGLGQGADRPTFTFGTAITATMVISAASVLIENVLFVNGIDNLTKAISITGADCTLRNIETRDNNASYHCDDFIVTTAAADRLIIDGWVHSAEDGKTGAATAISVVGGDSLVIKDFYIIGDFGTAGIENVTTACTNARIYGDKQSFIRTTNAADVCVTMVATSTGFIGPNINAMLKDDAANITEAFVGADMAFVQPINICNADGESSAQTNITASTDA